MKKDIGKKLDEKLTEIEELQAQVEEILHNKNPFYKWWHFGKAKKLHKLAHKKLEYISTGQFLVDYNIND